MNLNFEPDPTLWQAYVGPYGGIKISLKDNQLYVYSPNFGKEMPCVPLDNTRFACDWSYFEFNFDDNGAVSSLILADTWTFPRTQEASEN